jgi:hypothetical protein
LFFAGCGDGDSSPQFRGYCLDSESKAQGPGCTVLALDNDTGEPLPGKVAVADEDGVFEFNGLPEGYVGLKAVGVLGETEVTCLFNIPSDAQDQEILMVSFGTVAASLALAEVEWDRKKGVAAGSLLWFDGEIEGAGEEIGCATVNTDPQSGDERYFNDAGLPVPLADRSDTNPNNAYYLFANIDPGPVTVIAYIGTTEIGRTTLVSIANSFCISDIKLNPDNSDFTSNPTPAGCQ